MPPLTAATDLRLCLLFSPEEQYLVRLLLQDECGDNLPLLGAADSAAVERVRFAALKFSGGSMDRLEQALCLARTDWRDLLVAAEFAHDARAHEAWLPAARG